MKSLFMETTKIDPSQTVGEIQRILGKYGASAILMEYKAGEVTALSFRVRIEGQDIPFRLPCRSESIFEFLYKRKRRGTQSDRIIESMKAQAKRVAWRQILRWVEAQLALVDTRMVSIEEVFLPYMQNPMNGRTLFETLSESSFKLLAAPENA